jgi:cytochrome c biogenesis protein CcdA
MMVREYIFLAAGCLSLGIVITFVVLGLCQYFGIDIDENWWVVAIPVVLSVIINITLIELYRKIRRR